MADVLVVSDTHLSARSPSSAESWETVLAFVEATGPDLVVHLGDLTLDGSNDPDELESGREALDRLGVPWVALPGNHDIGDNPSERLPAEWHVDETRVRRWLDAVGPDRAHLELGGVHLVGFNAMLAGSGLEAEEGQWAWLAERLAGIPAGTPVVLATHKPIEAPEAELAASSARFLHAEGRHRLRGLTESVDVVMVLSGHVHQHRVLELGGRTHYWAPTTWALLPEEHQPTIGEKCCGVVRLTLEGGAAGAVLAVPPGMRHNVLGIDIDDPYRAEP